MKTVYTCFCTEVLHEGHLNIIEEAHKRGKVIIGCLSDEAVADLRVAGVEFEVGTKTNYKTSKLPVRMEYIDETDSRDFQFIPSWKRLCVCILKNDHVGKYMGFSLSKREVDRRNAILDKYRNL